MYFTRDYAEIVWNNQIYVRVHSDWRPRTPMLQLVFWILDIRPNLYFLRQIPTRHQFPLRRLFAPASLLGSAFWLFSPLPGAAHKTRSKGPLYS